MPIHGYLVPNAPVVLGNASPTAKTVDYSVLAGDLPGLFTNTGASGTVVFTLPAASTVHGEPVKFQVTAAQIVRCLPQSGEAVYLGGSGVVSKYLQIAGVIGNFCDLVCDGTGWIVTNYSGVVTKEA